MLFAHSFSPVEQSLFRRLSLTETMTQLDVLSLESPEYLAWLDQFHSHRVLLYSFQQLDYYKHLDSFVRELERVDWLLDYAKKHEFRQLILVTYPGAYVNSDNLFLQHKGELEAKFLSSGIPCAVLKVQGIYDTYSAAHNFHGLFFDRQEQAYFIPKKSGFSIYSVSVNNLADCVLGAMEVDFNTQYDVFDQVEEMKEFLQRQAPNFPVHGLFPLYLYFKSFLGQYSSPAMLELFLRPVISMYSYRAERDLHVSLQGSPFPSQRMDIYELSQTTMWPQSLGVSGAH